MEEFSNYIRGYYVCKEVPPVWEAAVGEALVCKREPENAFNRYAVAVKKELSVHLLRKLSQVCTLFLWQGDIQSQVWASSASTWNGDPTIVIMSWWCNVGNSDMENQPSWWLFKWRITFNVGMWISHFLSAWCLWDTDTRLLFIFVAVWSHRLLVLLIWRK